MSSAFDLERALADWSNWPSPWRQAPLFIRHLQGGATNTSALIEVGENDLVLRINTDNEDSLDINRKQERLFHRAAAKAGLAADIIYIDPAERYTLTRFVEGHTWALQTGARAEQQLTDIATLFARVHQLPVSTAIIDFKFKYTLYRKTIAAQHPELHQRLQAMDSALDSFWQEYDQSTIHYCPCHHDAVLANIVESQDGLMLLDWEYAAISDPWFDLATFAESAQLNQAQTRFLIESYKTSMGITRDCEKDFENARVCALTIELCWYGVQGEDMWGLEGRLARLAGFLLLGD